ncbi:MAG: M23 family metallopeptidase [Bacteroidota bacterium]|nr:M23 family metallopeptidase [Bacteroidota bacterium]
MAKIKYHFNTKSLEYELVKPGFKDFAIKALSVIAFGLVFSSIILLIAYNFFSSPKEKVLTRENENYRIQLKMLNEKLDNLGNVLTELQQKDNNIYRVIFEADPISDNIRKGGIGGAERYSKLEGYNNSDIIIATTRKADIIARQLYVQSKSFEDVLNMAKDKNKMLKSIPAIQPIKNKGLKQLVSGFGMRIHPLYKTLVMHTGVDFTATVGTPVYATGDGEIMNPAAETVSGYGNVIVVNHGYGYKTLYAHLSRKVVNPGQKVKRGEIIGYVGNTGISTGPHLHYEVIKNNVKINPVNFFYNDLSPAEYEKVIEIASKVNQSLS